LPDALKRAPLRIKVDSPDPKAQLLSKVGPWDFVIERAGSEDVLFAPGPVERLAYVDVSVTISADDTKFVFASLPGRFLLPVRR
jgi:hypothetical protein